MKTFREIMEEERFKPNNEQQQVMESDVNTVVSAGAGAGKTAVLSWRFLRLVMENGVTPDQILTLTFTKKAATEMRQRIYLRLMKARDSLGKEVLDLFSKATISTLDSFCLGIVRSDCLRYDLPRDIAILSDDDLDSMTERLSQKFILDPANQEETDLIASLFMPKDVISGFFGLVSSKVSLCGNYDSESIASMLRDAVRDYYQVHRTELGILFDQMSQVRMTPAFGRKYDELFYRYETESFDESSKFSLSGQRDPELKEYANQINEILGNGFYAVQEFVLRGGSGTSLLQRAVGKFATMLNNEKRRLGLLTFTDVSDLAVDILRNNLKVRRMYKEKFRYIMIDEFQDNNSRQRDMLFLLAEKESLGTSGHVPEVDEIEPHKLFFVGDGKQSIYRFRGADVSVFRKLESDITKNGSSLTLNMNYRSRAGLINHFNNVFQQVFGEAQQDFEADFAPIGAGRTKGPAESRIIFGVCNKADVDDSEWEDTNEVEAEAIGEYCRRILETDEFLVNGKRPREEDIAIVFASSGNQMNIEKALKRRGISYQIAETRSLMLDAVASDFYCFINYLLYPEDRRSLVALYRSPFCGMCEESIERVIRGKGLPLAVDERRFEVFTQFLEELEKKAFRLTIPQLVETLYIDGGYKAYLNSKANFVSFTEHYEYLYSYAEKYQSEGRGLNDYALFLRRYMGSSEKLPETTVLQKRRRGVQIMTVHKSKGLEFPVVIYSGTGSSGRKEGSSYVFEYNGKLVASENKAFQKILMDDRSDREQAELKRVMYVAFTRAMDHLIVTGSYSLTKDGVITGTTGNVFRWYADAIGFDPQENSCEDPDVEVEDLSGTKKAAYIASEGTDYINNPVNQDFVEYTYKPSRISVSELKARQGHSTGPFLETQLPRFGADRIIEQYSLQDRFGTLCHSVLENLLGRQTYKDVECRLCESEHDNQVLLDQARAFADSFLASPLYQDHAAGRQTMQEVRFYTSGNTPEEPAIEGVIDLLVLGEDCNLVIDYKTDSSRKPQEHKVQVLTYMKAAEELFAKPCYGILYYLRDGSTSEMWDADGNIVSQGV